MKPAPFDYVKTTSLEHALDQLAESGGEAQLLAGGQSLVPAMNFRLVRPARLIDINAIPGLDYVRRDGDWLRIGALARHSAFHRSVDDGPLGTLLVQVVRHIAHYPIRQRGTFAGSLAHADPASEWALTATTLGSVMTLASRVGVREVPAADFFKGIFTTELAEDEMLTEVRIPRLASTWSTGFFEYARRKGDFALAMAMAALEVRDGRISQARIGLGAVSDRPCRLVALEAELAGKPADPVTLRAAAQQASDVTEPLEDIHASADYRRELAGVAVARALMQAAGHEDWSMA